MKDLKHPEDTYTSVAERYHVSKATFLRLFNKHVDITRKPLSMVLSMDEHYFPESDIDSLYCCLLMNFITGELIDVLPTRRKHYLIDYFSSIRGDIQNYTLKRSELNNVKYISMDLYDNFSSEPVPESFIVSTNTINSLFKDKKWLEQYAPAIETQ